MLGYGGLKKQELVYSERLLDHTLHLCRHKFCCIAYLFFIFNQPLSAQCLYGSMHGANLLTPWKGSIATLKRCHTKCWSGTISPNHRVSFSASSEGFWASLMMGCECGYRGVSGMGAISLRCSTEAWWREERDISPFGTGHWLTQKDEEEREENKRSVKTESAWEWLILSFTAQQLWHITNVMAVIDFLCAISLPDKYAPMGGLLSFQGWHRAQPHSSRQIDTCKVFSFYRCIDITFFPNKIELIWWKLSRSLKQEHNSFSNKPKINSMQHKLG